MFPKQVGESSRHGEWREPRFVCNEQTKFEVNICITDIGMVTSKTTKHQVRGNWQHVCQHVCQLSMCACWHYVQKLANIATFSLMATARIFHRDWLPHVLVWNITHLPSFCVIPRLWPPSEYEQAIQVQLLCICAISSVSVIPSLQYQHQSGVQNQNT